MDQYLIIIIVLLILIIFCRCLVVSEYFGSQNDKVLNIIIPYRNRQSDLKEFEARIPKILDQLGLNYIFWLVEQSEDNQEFNKGRLINIGYLESQKHDSTNNYYCVHDVDIFPETTTAIKYDYYDRVYNAYGSTARLGGIFFLDKKAWERSNGFSNNYWGWGSEDNDFIWRIRQEAGDNGPLVLDNSDVKAGINTHEAKKQGKKPGLKDIYIPNDSTNHNKKDFSNNIKLWEKNQPEYTRIKSYRHEGLNTCKYKLERKIKIKNGYRLLVTFDKNY
jgi:hypothetical protein